MDFKNISLFTQNAAALTKTTKKEAKAEEKPATETAQDNKPATQMSGEDILTFMASKNIDLVATKKVDSTKGAEDRVSGYMADFEAAYNEAASMGLSEKAILSILDKM